MSRDKTTMQRLNDTASRSLKSCVGCSTVDGLASCLDDEIERIDDHEGRIVAASERISLLEINLAQQSGNVTASLEALRHEIGSLITVIGYSRRGFDVRNSTPAGKGDSGKIAGSEFKLPGGASWKGPTAAIATVLVIGCLFAMVAYLGGKVIQAWPVPTQSIKTP